MNQVFEKIYEDYKRANKLAKERMIKKYQFETEKEFFDYLGVTSPDPASNPSKTSKRRKTPPALITPPIMHNVYILDASGSMGGGKIRSALEGINEEMKALKIHADADYTTQTIVDFSDANDINNKMWKEAVKNAPVFNTHTRGLTALFEAIGKTLTKLLGEYKDGEKVLVKIFTDGEENASGSEWRGDVIPKLIKEAEAKGFVVTFVGTSKDVAFAINKLNLKQSNTLVHDNTASGVAKSFKKSIGATVSYRAATTKGIDTQEDFFI